MNGMYLSATSQAPGARQCVARFSAALGYVAAAYRLPAHLAYDHHQDEATVKERTEKSGALLIHREALPASYCLRRHSCIQIEAPFSAFGRMRLIRRPVLQTIAVREFCRQPD